jgi:K+-transporting ATPase ATPase C chain
MISSSEWRPALVLLLVLTVITGVLYPLSMTGVASIAFGETAGGSLRAAHPEQANRPVPVDLVTASASGLDPHVSVAGIAYQVERVARARNLPVEKVLTLVAAHTQGRVLGIFGEPRVNVVELNLALDAMERGTR